MLAMKIRIQSEVPQLQGEHLGQMPRLSVRERPCGIRLRGWVGVKARGSLSSPPPTCGDDNRTVAFESSALASIETVTFSRQRNPLEIHHARPSTAAGAVSDLSVQGPKI
jgi:hypothetical protein